MLSRMRMFLPKVVAIVLTSINVKVCPAPKLVVKERVSQNVC